MVSVANGSSESSSSPKRAKELNRGVGEGGETGLTWCRLDTVWIVLSTSTLNEEGIPTGILGGEWWDSAGSVYEEVGLYALTVVETVCVGRRHPAGMEWVTGIELDAPEDTGKDGKEAEKLGGTFRRIDSRTDSGVRDTEDKNFGLSEAAQSRYVLNLLLLLWCKLELTLAKSGLLLL
jgi:hypothetical protein